MEIFNCGGGGSGGYYGFHFVTLPPQPQCVKRFHCYRSNKKNIIATSAGRSP